MGTRIAQNNPSTNSEMPGRFSFKNHVKKLTKECLKAFDSDHKSNFQTKNNDRNVEANEISGDNIMDGTILLKSSDSLENFKLEKSQIDVINVNAYQVSATQELIDGVDSGVEVIRPLSSNGSSDRYTPAQSCGSSLLSCYSELEGDRGSDCGSENSKDDKTKKNGKGLCSSKDTIKSKNSRVERSRIGCRKVVDKELSLSESCSENSSISESQTLNQSRISDFGRTVSNRLQNSKKSEYLKTSMVRRADSINRMSSRDRSLVRSRSSSQSVTSQLCNSGIDRHTLKSRNSRTLQSGATEVKKSKPDETRRSLSVQKSKVTDSRCRNSVEPFRTKLNLSSVMSSSVASANSVASSVSTCAGKISLETKSNALDKYGTLPRRPKRKSLENNQNVEIVSTPITLARSSSVSREPSLNRASTLRRQQSREKEQINISNGKSLPPYPKSRRCTGKTIIYHEISIQTSVTGEDISNILAGRGPPDPVMIPAVEKANKAVQSEGREKLKKMEENFSKQAKELENEKRENERLKSERQIMMSRICKMLGYPEVNGCGSGTDEMNELEQHFQAVGLTVIKQQEELSELRHFKSIMQRDLEKSFAAQKNLLQQQQDIEAEYFELQEFLQAEKTALSESLNDTEAELESLRKEICRKESLLQQQEEECKHLVRICEQRRQENLSLEAKLTGLEQRSRDVIVQQGAAVSGAAVALSGLGARLDNLVEQLAASCNISEKDLEDVVYHNEAYSQSQSEDNSPDVPALKNTPEDVTGSPKKGHTFLNAIMGALRNATQTPFATTKKNSMSHSQTDHISESFGLLEQENDHYAALEHGFEENASSVSHYTDCGSCSSRSELMKYDICDDTVTLVPNIETSSDLSHSDSIQNLSAAILARQEIEKIERNLSPDLIIPIEVNSLVDKVIDVDNLLTKLLKVLRIIQVENDESLEHLEDQRSELTEKLQQEQLCRQKTEDHLQTLQYELKEARSQLSARIVQLEQTKIMLNQDARIVIADSQRRFAAIHDAVGTLQSIQDVVNQYPPLLKLQQDLEEYSYRLISSDDLNANTASNGSMNSSAVKEIKRNGPALTTAV